MRTLAAPPSCVVDAAGTPKIGSYRGALPAVSLAEPSTLGRLLRHKRWLYALIASGDFLLAAAVVKLGYVSKCFVFAVDKTAGRIAADHSWLAPAFAASVADSAEQGCEARFHFGSAAVCIERPRGLSDYTLEVRAPDLVVAARLATAAAPTPISAVARLPGGLTSVTQKRALLSVEGEAMIRGERRRLDGGFAGLDYSQGNLPRHTVWRWAFALGRTTTGERVGLNLVEGFVGEAECAVWVDSELYPLPEGRFAFDAAHPDSRWQVQTACGKTRLAFDVLGVHAERMNLGIVASRFIQAAGCFSGTIDISGRGSLMLERVLGVTEDQDVLW